MNKRLAAALFMLLAVTLWWRLDVDGLHAAIRSQMVQIQGVHLDAERVSLSLIHGIGLRLDDVQLTSPRLKMQAGHVNISLHLLPLLFGKIETGTLDIHDAHLKLAGNAVTGLSASLATLPFDRVQLNRCTLEDASSIPQLEDIQLDVRNIGMDREALWEISARQHGYALQGHGQLAFRAGSVMSGFGKVKFKNIPASLFLTIMPNRFTSWLSDQQQYLSGGLTLDIVRHKGWSLFGELDASESASPTEGDGIAGLRVRGKLKGTDEGQFAWHDSFIHLQDRAVIALDGECTKGLCQTKLDAQHIPVDVWLRLLQATTAMPVLSGDSRLTASIAWQASEWQATGNARLSHLSFVSGKQSLALPSMQITLDTLHGDAHGWQGESEIQLEKQQVPLQLQVSSTLQHTNDVDSFGWKLGLKKVTLEDGVWQPLAQLLLSSLDIQPVMSGTGGVKARLQLEHRGDQNELELEVDATTAEVEYNNRWLKAAGVTAMCSARVGWITRITMPNALLLEGCKLSTSGIDSLAYRQSESRDELKFTGLLADMNALNQQQLGLDGVQGRIEAGGSLAWKHGTGQLIGAGGDWSLQQLGTATWQLSGNLKARDGVVSSEHISMSGSKAQLEMNGSLRLSDHRGWIDVLGGHLDWQAMPGMPAFWSDLHISGSLHQVHLDVIGYQWKDIESGFELLNDRLTLLDGRVAFAGGWLETPSLLLLPSDGGLRLDGKLKASDVNLEKVPWLTDWLQADLSGQMQANIELKGVLPLKDLKTWRRSNGDITIYSGVWSPHRQTDDAEVTTTVPIQNSSDQAATVQDGGPDGGQALSDYSFKSMGLRFRVHHDHVDIPSISLVSHGEEYFGQSMLDEKGELRGRLVGHQVYDIDGTWPFPAWHVSSSHPGNNN